MATSPPTETVWDSTRLQNPHAEPDKRSRVQQMFSAIAPSYDINNRLHSLGIDQYWRRKTVKVANLKRTDSVVDVACGTGDLTLKFAGALKGNAVTGVDFAYAMLPLARVKAAGFRGVRFVNGDAQALPLPDGCADVVSIAFGIRNVQDVATALREFRRVLRPGGRLVILEFSVPRNAVVRFTYNFYCQKIMPWTATWISRDRSGAYKYLPHSVATFLTPSEFVPLLKEAGFSAVELVPLTFGTVTVIKAVV